ncbi:MAG: ABC transporter ATP-binding protein [Actinomycetota bacterium]
MIPVTASGLSVSYGGSPVIEDLDLDVGAGAWLTLIGPNGAGKTTVLRAIAGLVSFEGGVRIGSLDVRRATRREVARSVAYVPQRPLMPAGTSVDDYLLMGRNPYIGYFSTETRADLVAVNEVVDRLDLGALRKREVASLSGGEAQRVVLARALAQEAPVLLLDEPTSELDVGHQQQVLELVDQLRTDPGLTVLSTMHDLTLAGQYSKEFVLVDHGRAVARGSAQEVLRADLIQLHYGASVEIVANASGLVVIPTRPQQQEVLVER